MDNHGSCVFYFIGKFSYEVKKLRKDAHSRETEICRKATALGARFLFTQKSLFFDRCVLLQYTHAKQEQKQQVYRIKCVEKVLWQLFATCSVVKVNQ